MSPKTFSLALACLALVATACSKDSAAATAPAPRAQAASGNNFTVNATDSGCSAGKPCTLTLALTVTNADFHINDEYPYKFVADDAAGLKFQGTSDTDPHVFVGKANDGRDFKKDDATHGRMTVKFQPADKGTKTISGTFKLSVCSSSNCQLEKVTLQAAVVVK